jgi:hypothetical protein
LPIPPTAAFVLSLIAGVLILLGGIFGAIVGIIGGAMIGVIPGLGWLGGLIVILGFLGLIFGIIVIVGAVMINSGERDRVKTGSIVVLISSILTLFVGGIGGYTGFIVGFIGGMFGLLWKPTEEAAPPPENVFWGNKEK